MKRIYLLLVTLATLLLFSASASAQTPMIAKPEENARMKPLVAAETKARENLNAKIATLPEVKAYNDAKAAFEKATAALNAAAEKLPENAEWKAAGAKALDMAYMIQAEHSLSSRAWKPQLNDKGDLEFVKIEPPKP